MSAFAFEYEHAKQEGVRFLWRVMPVRIHSNEHGIRSIECVQAAIGDDGVLAAVPGSNFHFDCQQIIYAIGQSPLLELLSRLPRTELEQRPRRRSIAPPGRRPITKYFAGGDCVNGGREVVDAVADGKRRAGHR